MHSSYVAKNSSCRAGIELAGIHDHVAVDDHIGDPARIAVRILEGRLVANRRGIEEREIGKKPGRSRPRERRPSLAAGIPVIFAIASS